MAVHYIPCDFPVFPIPYGCWCGITVPFPAKHEPIDIFDEQCKIHDYCYEDALNAVNIFDFANSTPNSNTKKPLIQQSRQKRRAAGGGAAQLLPAAHSKC